MSPTPNRAPRIRSLQSVINRMRFPAIVLSIVIAFTASTAMAVPVQAIGTMTVDGDEWSVPIDYNSELGLYGIGSWDSNIENFTGFHWDEPGPEGFSVDVSGVLDPDPSIGWGVTVTDFGAPSIFGFFFTTPIIVGPGPTTVDASVSGGLTDFTGNGVAITPTGPLLAISTVGLPTTSMGVDVGPAVGFGPGPPGAHSYGLHTAGPMPGPAGPWSVLSVTVGFSLSGGADVASLTGFSQIVPEPSSVVMMVMSGLGLLICARFRRRR
jgi:hypothetical protein